MKTAEEIFRKHIFLNMEDISVVYDTIDKKQILEAMKEYAIQFIELAAKKGEEEAPVHLSGNITYAVLKIKELVK